MEGGRRERERESLINGQRHALENIARREGRKSRRNGLEGEDAEREPSRSLVKRVGEGEG